MIVDAEQHIDVRMRLKRVEAGAQRMLEDSAPVDAPMLDVARKGRR